MFVVLVTGLLSMLIGQVHAQLVPPLRFATHSIEDGLSSVLVWDILQDQRGFLWIATGDGLNRYDGHHFTVFRAGGPGALSHDQVWSLHEDTEGILWVGTYGGGLDRLDTRTETFSHFRYDPDDTESLPSDIVYEIFEDHAGTTRRLLPHRRQRPGL